MKHITRLFFVCLCILFFAASASAIGVSSGKQTGSILIHTGPCTMYGVLVTTDGTNTITLKIYDNTSAAGTVLPDIIIPGAPQRSVYVDWVPGGRKMAVGIYVAVTCAGTMQYEVYKDR